MYESMKNTAKALNTTSEVETPNESGIISNAHRIDKELRKLGLTNGTSLGHHSGFADEVADCIESLLDLIEDLESRSMIPSKSPDITKTPTIKLPNGDQVYARLTKDEAIDLYRIRSESDTDEDQPLATVEYNFGCEKTVVMAYKSGHEEPVYNEPIDN